MSPTAEEILESDAWKHAFAQIEHDLWAEHALVALGDVEKLARLQACRWALHRVQGELERRLVTTSINLQK